MLPYFEQHIEPFGGHFGQVVFPRLDDFRVGFGPAAEAAEFVAKLGHTDFAAFEQREGPCLAIGAQEGADVEAEAGKAVYAALLVEVYEHPAKVEEEFHC